MFYHQQQTITWPSTLSQYVINHTGVKEDELIHPCWAFKIKMKGKRCVTFCAFKVGCTLTTYFFSICKAYSRAHCNARPVTMMGGLAQGVERGPEGIWRRATGLSVKCVGRRWPPGVKKMYLGSREVAKREKELYRQDPPGWVRGRAISHVVNEEGDVSQRLTEAECWCGLSPATMPRGPVPRQNPKSSCWIETEPK